MLSGLGFTQLIEKRLTPRLVFYVLGRNIPGDSHGNIPQGDSKNVLLSALQDDDSTNRDPKRNTKRDTKSDKKRRLDSASESSQSSLCSVKYDWLATVQSSITANMKKNISDYFLKDCSGVPPVEFCLSLASVILKKGA